DADASITGIDVARVNQSIFVAKLAGGGLAFSFDVPTGTGSGDRANAVALDAAGNIYVTGTTNAHDDGGPVNDGLPLVNALQSPPDTQQDAFLLKYSSDGSRQLFGTYLGGTGGESGHGIAIGPDGSVHVVGATTSANFPTVNAFQSNFGGTTDAFV